MSNDLLPTLDILAGPPNDADRKGAVLAATNGSGDGLLTHDISFNSHAPTNGVVTKVDRLDAVAADDSAAQAPAVPADGLADLALTIRQIESTLKANGVLVPEVHFAIERIQDVAMALRMRDIDAALCDTLETFIREVGDAIVRHDAAAARALGAAALLRDLARRVDQMMPGDLIVAVAPEPVDEPASMQTSGDCAAKANGAAGPIVHAAGVVMSDDDQAALLPQPGFVHPALPEMQAFGDAKEKPAALAQPVVLLVPSPVDDDEDAAAADSQQADLHVQADLHANAISHANNEEAVTASEPISVDAVAFAVSDRGQATPAATTSSPLPAEKAATAPVNSLTVNSTTSTNGPLTALYGLSEEELIALFS